MTEKQHKIIDKVKKLLRLAASSSFESEAKAAAVRAQELLREYRLEISDVDDLREDDNCDESEIFVLCTEYIPTHIKLLVQAIECGFFVKAIYAWRPVNKKGSLRYRRSVRFVGVVPDCHIARQLFEFLWDFSQRKAREQGVIGAKRSAFLQGFALAVEERLEHQARCNRQQETSQETALVLSRRGAVDTYFKRKYPNIGTSRNGTISGDLTGMREGYREGEKVSLDRPVEYHPQNLALGA